MKMRNRLDGCQADYLFLIVRPPTGWHPKDPLDVPPGGEVQSVEYVASFDEARDDLLRCNQVALEQYFGRWAVVHSGGGEL